METTGIENTRSLAEKAGEKIRELPGARKLTDVVAAKVESPAAQVLSLGSSPRAALAHEKRTTMHAQTTAGAGTLLGWLQAAKASATSCASLGRPQEAMATELRLSDMETECELVELVDGWEDIDLEAAGVW